MADQKLTELNLTSPLPTPVVATDLFYVVRGGNSFAASGFMLPLQSGMTAVNNSLNTLTSNLTNTGVSLLSVIAQTGSTLDSKINSLSGYDAGVYATQVNLQSTGQQAWTAANSNAVNLSGNLTQTGATLGSKIDSLSGWSASAANLTSTGSTLDGKIGSLSGWSASAANLQSTGSTLDGRITTVSTNLGTTGSTLDGKINSLSGWSASAVNLASTGSTLDNKIGSLSGWSASAVNLTTTGATLDGRITTVASNLATTGTALNDRIGSLSGWSASAVNLATTGSTLDNKIGSLSGWSASAANLASTGQQAWSAANANALNLSGNLTATGQALSAVKVTGSNVVNAPNFSGIGGTQVILSGSMVLISGGGAGAGDVTLAQLNSLSGWAASANNLTQTGATLISLISAASTGVSTLNGASGVLNILGAGNVTVTTVGQNITVSGSGGDTSAFATIVNLAATGSTLDSKINSLSGWSASAVNLTATGSTLDGRITTVANNLATTGSNLDSKINSLSGWSASAASLTTTGVNLGSKIDSLSGWSASAVNLTSTGSTLDGRITTVASNLATTGSTLNSKINSLSGWSASAANLAATGSTLDSKINSLSGWSASAANLTATGSTLDGRINTVVTNLGTTGSTLDNRITSLSGWSASALNLASTGSTLNTKIDSLSGWSASAANLTATGSTLWNRDISISGAIVAQIGASPAQSQLLVSVSQASHGFTLGDIIRSSGANLFTKARADTAVNAEAVGYVTFVTDSSSFQYSPGGLVTGNFVAAPGNVLFLSPYSSGSLTNTEPTTVGQISKPLISVLESGSKGIFLNLRGVQITATAAEGIGQNFQFGTSYTLQSTDLDKNVVISSLTAAVLTVPAVSGVYFPTGAQVLLTQFNTGQITVSPIHANVTVSGRDGALKLAGRYAQASLTMVSGDYWVLAGDISTT
jgi:mucin-19